MLYFWVSPPVAHGKSLEVEPYCIIGDVFVSKPDPVSNCRHIMARVTLSYDKQWRIHELRPFLGLEKCLDEKS